MFRTIDDFVAVWKDESAMTAKVFATLTDASLNQSINNDHRTIGRIAWHITQTIPEMLGHLGLVLKGPAEAEPVPSSAKTILDAYNEASSSIAPALDVARWTDADLATEHPVYGESWTAGFTLRVLVFHEAHHRGQITVLMRQAGLRVPGLYGPAKEDWASMGMPVPPI